MTGRNCVMKGCGVTINNTIKRHLHCFPLNDPERCQQWVDICGSDAVKKHWKDGTLTRRARVCGDHFPKSDRSTRILPKHAIPIPKCCCYAIAHDHFVGQTFQGCDLCRPKGQADGVKKVVDVSLTADEMDPLAIPEMPEMSGMIEASEVCEKNTLPDNSETINETDTTTEKPKPTKSKISAKAVSSVVKILAEKHNLKKGTMILMRGADGGQIMAKAVDSIPIAKPAKKVEVKPLNANETVSEAPKIIKPVPLFRQVTNVYEEEMRTRCTIVHAKRPTCALRKRNFRIFTDSTVSRWMTVPSEFRVKSLSYLSRFQDLNTFSKVAEITKTVNHTMEAKYSDINEESETELWDLYPPNDSASTSVVTKSSWAKQPYNVSPVTLGGMKFWDPDADQRLLKVTRHNGMPSTAPTSLSVPAVNAIVPYQTTVSNVLKNQMITHNTNATAVSNSIVWSNKQVPNSQIGSVSLLKTSPKVTGLGQTVRSMTSDSAAAPNLDLTPRQEYGNFDFTNAGMVYWTYDCGNGVIETVVECVSSSDKSRIVRVTAKEVIQQLQLNNKKLLFAATYPPKRKKDRKKCEHVKQIRRLKYRIAQLNKELDAPKPYEKFLNDDQIEAMDKDSTQGHHWKDDTIVLAHNIRMACTTKGYKYLSRKLKWPLPSLKTLQKRAKLLHLPCPHVIRAVIVRKPNEKKEVKSEETGETTFVTETILNENGEYETIVTSKKPQPKKIIKPRKKKAIGANSAKAQDGTHSFNGEPGTEPTKKVVQKKRKRKLKTEPEESILKSHLTKVKKEPEEGSPYVLEYPQYYSDSEIAYSEENVIVQTTESQNMYHYDHQLQTLANASILHREPQDRNVVVHLPEGHYRGFDDQFHRLLGMNALVYPGTQ